MFIKKKNLQEGEELLYTPELHWMYVIKPILPFLPILVFLFILWQNLAGMAIFGIAFVTSNIVRNAFLSVLLVAIVICVVRIFSYLSTEFGITNQRLMKIKGSPATSVEEIHMGRITAIDFERGILGKVFRYGTLTVFVGGKPLTFEMVRRPLALRRKIVDIFEKNKVVTVVHGDLPKPPRAPSTPEPEPAKEPIYRYGTFVQVLRNDD